MMRRIARKLVVAALVTSLAGGTVFARGFGGGARGGGGFRGGGFEGARGGFGGGGYGGMSSFGRSPSFSSPGTFGRGEGMGYGARGGAEGIRGGQIQYGSRSGSYETARGGSVNYGAAGVGGRGPGGFEAGRGAYGVSGTTANGRSFGDAGRVGGAAGPGGTVVGGRENFGAVAGPRGAAVGGSRSGFASGPNGFAAGRSGFGATASRPYGYNAYGGYHSGWVHGYWNGHDDAAWGWGGAALGLGVGLGWGLSSWGYGSSLYGMGYMPYANPYDLGGGAGFAGSPYDYSRPIDTSAAPVEEAVASPAMALFDAARASFQQGNYPDALAKADAALATLPNDTTLHEFRALCLFGLARYDEAAATLYGVLSVGPGWDWTTMIGLYPGVDVYTAQLRALEDACIATPGSAPDRFVLAYHYLTQGHTPSAVDLLKQVLALRPGDALSARLLRQLDPPAGPPPAAPVPVDPGPPPGATIAGTWTARPAAGTEVTLTIQPGGAFTWRVAGAGQPREFSGASTFGDGILTLARDQGPALVGRVAWTDPGRMNFRIAGDGPDDPGLAFSK